MKIRKVFLKLSLLFLFAFLIVSCATKPKFTGNADLCGLVVDENNRPVKGFIIHASCGLSGMRSAVTNENGIFVIENVPSGKIVISGEKKNYSKLSNVNYQFINRTDILCCQIKSIRSVIKLVDELLERDEIQSACNLLDNVACEKKSVEWALIQSYKFFLTDSNHKKKEILSLLKSEMSESRDELFAERRKFFSEYTKEMEVSLK